MMHRNAAKTLVALATALTASAAVHAQTAAPVPAPAVEAPVVAPLTANVSLVSNYKFRGQDQDTIGSNGYYKKKGIEPALQGGFDYSHESGFYIGNWNSSVNWLSGNSIESDLYGGYKFKAGAVDLDFGVLTYIYPGNSIGNTTEVYGAATFADDAIGAFTLKYSHTVSKDYFGYAGYKSGSGLKGQNTGYLNLAYSKLVAPNLTLKAAVGFTHMSSDIRSLGYKSYVDYNVGATYDFGGGLSLSGAVQGANKKGNYQATIDPGYDFGFGPVGMQTTSPNKARFVATLTKTF